MVDVRNNEPQRNHENSIDATLNYLSINEPLMPGKQNEGFSVPSTKKNDEKSKTMKQQEIPRGDMVFSKNLSVSEKNFATRESKDNLKSATSTSSDTEKKKSKLRLREQRILAFKESQWQGRSGGMDVGKFDLEGLRDTIKMRKKKVQRGELAPIADILNEANTLLGHDSSGGELSPSRIRSEKGRNDIEELLLSADESLSESEKAVKVAIKKARGKRHRKRRRSMVEARLIQSPFADPVESAKSMI